MAQLVPLSSDKSSFQQKIGNEESEKFSGAQILTAMTVASLVSVSILSLVNFVPILTKCPNNEHCYEADVATTDVIRAVISIGLGIAAGVAVVF